MTIVREFLVSNSADTKVILMSATFKADIIFKYFSFDVEGSDLVKSVVMEEAERTHNIDVHFLDDFSNISVNFTNPSITPQLLEVAANIIIDRLSKSTNSILVFLPGLYEIGAMHTALRNIPDIADSVLVCVLHSSLSSRDQKIAFSASDKPKVILATNIAESGVTITGPEVDCVIDFCLEKLLMSGNGAMASLKTDWASKCSLEQRAGRTGRTCDGSVFRMINRRLFVTRLSDYAVPEMLRSPLETVLLRVKTLDIEPPISLLSKTISPPDPAAIRHSILVLKSLGGMLRKTPQGEFLHDDGELGYIGRIMAALPIDVRITKFILNGYIFSILDEAIIIGAGLHIRSIFRTSNRNILDDFNHKLAFADGHACDFFAILNAYKLWKMMSEQGHFTTLEQQQQWCDRFNLERRSLHEMHQLVEEITERLASLNLAKLTGALTVSWEEAEKPLLVKLCAAGAFMPNLFITGECCESVEQEIYKALSGRDPNRTVYFRHMSKNHVGEVYERQLREKFVAAGISNKVDDVKVVFDKGSTKIFVQFLNESMVDDEHYDEVRVMTKYEYKATTVPEKVLPEVYKSVKLRRSDYKFTLQVMSSEDTNNYALEHGLASINRNMFELNLNHMRFPQLCAVPLTCDKFAKGFVTHVEHCGKFFIQPLDLQHQNTRELIEQNMAEMATETFSSFKELQRDQLVVVPHGNKLKRAKVTATCRPTLTASCYLIDYGATVEVLVKKIFKVSSRARSDIFDVPEWCYEATLTGLEPSLMKCPRRKWTSAAIDQFRQLVLNREVKVEIFSVVEDVASVKLFTGNASCVNEVLKSAGFAQTCEESYTSRVNHEIREDNQRSSRFGADIEFKRRTDKFNVPTAPHPPKVQCRETVKLSGPHSPLETTISGTSANSYSSGITVDPTSVNSIQLVDDPSNIVGRLLVAANVTKSPKGVVLHETTSLPNIPGLAVLIPMMFAPDAVFKRSDDKTRYEYIHFGLGADADYKAYFPEQDGVVNVNIELELEDFEDVHQLRYCMSNLMLKQPDEEISSLDDGTKFELLEEVKKVIVRILGKNRLQLPMSYAKPESSDWVVEDQQGETTKWIDYFNGSAVYHLYEHPWIQLQDRARAKRLMAQIADMEQKCRL